MPWNWQLADWPLFKYDARKILEQERQFFLFVGEAFAFLKDISRDEYTQFITEILTQEGSESSKIEGVLLNRESLRSSIKKHFGLKASKSGDKETAMAEMLCHAYATLKKPLTHNMLWTWHSKLFQIRTQDYRTHPEPMQIVSHKLHAPKIYFEAPPSSRIPAEMDCFIEWFNTKTVEPILARAAVAHVYFESLHPFEDGNGRIGRALIEKMLSQAAKNPLLISVSKILEKRKKEYYMALERCNRSLHIDPWVEFFAEVVLQAQKESLSLLDFLIQKSKLLTTLSGQLNPRQEKALLRMYKEGLNGFKGGLSAEKYIAITKASRATATRDLADLVQKGALVKVGELRHTRYFLPNGVDAAESITKKGGNKP
jgi:Fic family protein